MRVLLKKIQEFILPSVGTLGQNPNQNHIALSIQLGTDVEVFMPKRRKKMAYNTWRRKTNDPQLMKS
jgi:Holliday junction resolvase RusA-like endonuclease